MSESRARGIIVEEQETLAAYFRDELERVHEDMGIETSDHTRAYLVYLLEGQTRLIAGDEAVGFDRPAALMLSDAVYGAPGARAEAYRKLGDACLYNCGFFAETLTRRSVPASYYESMGRNAYEHALGLRRRGPFAAVFEELSEKFAQLVRALRRLSARHSPSRELAQLIRQMRLAGAKALPG